MAVWELSLTSCAHSYPLVLLHSILLTQPPQTCRRGNTSSTQHGAGKIGGPQLDVPRQHMCGSTLGGVLHTIFTYRTWY